MGNKYSRFLCIELHTVTVILSKSENKFHFKINLSNANMLLINLSNKNKAIYITFLNKINLH